MTNLLLFFWALVLKVLQWIWWTEVMNTSWHSWKVHTARFQRLCKEAKQKHPCRNYLKVT